MATAEEIRRVSELAAQVLSEVFEAHAEADRFTNPALSDKQTFAKGFIRHLYSIESLASDLVEALRAHGHAFARVNSTAVEIWQPVASSCHEAVGNLCYEVGGVAREVVLAEFAGSFRPGVEYQVPKLCCETDLLRHIDVAVRSFKEFFPDYDVLNRARAQLDQELARAVDGIPEDATHAPSITERAVGYGDAELKRDLEARGALRLPARGAAQRDYLWWVWWQAGLGPAAIRDRWNGLTEERRRTAAPDCALPIGSDSRGSNAVKSALRVVKAEISDHDIG